MEQVKLTEQHKKRYLSSLRSDFASQARRYLQQFYELSGGDGSKDGLDKYLKYIREELGYKDGTVRYIYGILHRFYRINSLPWPYTLSDIPTIRERNVFAPILDEKVIAEMIMAGKTGALSRVETMHLALATTYGLRRIELANITARDISIRERLIYIETKHMGRERYHIIPEVIVPYIHPSLVAVKRHTKALDRMFQRIEQRIGFPHYKELGWHSIRRCLDRSLNHAGLPGVVIEDFLRWKRSSRDMRKRYAMGTVIGRETTNLDLAVEDREVDEAVFAKHPFLPLWA